MKSMYCNKVAFKPTWSVGLLAGLEHIGLNRYVLGTLAVSLCFKAKIILMAVRALSKCCFSESISLCGYHCALVLVLTVYCCQEGALVRAWAAGKLHTKTGAMLGGVCISVSG